MVTTTRIGQGACRQPDPAQQPVQRLVPARMGTAPGDGVYAELGRMPAPIELAHYIISGTGGHGRARVDALLEIIRAFGCRAAVFGYDATDNDKFLVLVGARPMLDALDLLLLKIERQMELAARTAAAQYGEEVWAALPRACEAIQRSTLMIPYFRDFMRGYGRGAADTISDLRAEIIQAGAPSLARILEADDVRAEDAYNRRFPDSAESVRELVTHPDGLVAGYEAGRAAGHDEHYEARHDLVFAML